jgi:hypothetical protein
LQQNCRLANTLEPQGCTRRNNIARAHKTLPPQLIRRFF